MADEKIVGWRPPKDRHPEIDTRRVRAMLARLAALDPRPLAEARPPERRLVDCCRDFTVLLCAMARHHGIPIRARVGFARYFIPDFHVDHEIVEWWDSGERRWRLVDPELSERHLAHYQIGFDPFDVPRNQFIVGGRAWQLCRTGAADPETFGLAPDLPEPRGIRFVRGHVIQDLAALITFMSAIFTLSGCATSVSFQSADQTTTVAGTLFKPDGSGPFPAVVLLHGCGGIRPHFVQWAGAIRDMGYVALLVDSFRPRGI